MVIPIQREAHRRLTRLNSEVSRAGFWGGDDKWRVRFAPPQPGRYECHSICTDANDGGLHGQSCTIQADAYAGSNE